MERVVPNRSSISLIYILTPVPVEKKMKQIKVIKTLLILTLLTNIFITPLQVQSIQQTQNTKPPEVDPERLRVNQTETIPKDYMHTNTPGDPQQLQFKNMVLELTTTRKMTMSITSDEQVRFQYLTMTMEMTQNMQMNIQMTQSPPENIPEPENGLKKYLTIEPNSSDPIRTTMRLYLNQEEIPEDSTIEQFTWCYWNGTHWDPTPTRYTYDGFLETNTTHLSIWTVKEKQAERPREIPAPDSPGLHAETKAYNYTDTTPSGFQYKMSENTPTMLQFRNSAIYMHCTSPVELEYSAEEQNRNRLMRVEVESETPLQLRFNLRESKPDEVSTPEKGIGFYCEIEPNQTITQARLGYEIDPVELQSKNMEPEKLSWAYWSGNQWQMVESSLSAENVLMAETDHFSIWTILELEEAPEEPEDSGDNLIPIPSYAIAIGLLATLVVMMRKTQ